MALVDMEMCPSDLGLGSETDLSPQLMALISIAVLVPMNVAGMLRQDHSWEMGESWFPLTLVTLAQGLFNSLDEFSLKMHCSFKCFHPPLFLSLGIQNAL